MSSRPHSVPIRPSALVECGGESVQSEPFLRLLRDRVRRTRRPPSFRSAYCYKMEYTCLRCGNEAASALLRSCRRVINAVSEASERARSPRPDHLFRALHLPPCFEKLVLHASSEGARKRGGGRARAAAPQQVRRSPPAKVFNLLRLLSMRR